jgi:DNA-binding IclR family transcriptional regulator
MDKSGQSINPSPNARENFGESIRKPLDPQLLLLARYGKEDQPHGVLPKVSQETLAEMIGTTRSRVNFFMNKFTKLGFIQYNDGGFQVHKSLLSVGLHE